jgi:photosystem II stability/assembly factor-like uncharacterized protein
LGSDADFGVYQIQVPVKGFRQLTATSKIVQTDPSVSLAVHHFLQRVQRVADDPGSGLSYVPPLINLPAAWDLTTGSKVPTLRIGIIDSVFDLGHQDLVGNVAKANQVLTPGINHGTRVASIVGAQGNNGIGIAGVMWNANLYLYSASVAQNDLDHLDTMVALHSAMNDRVRIINLSTAFDCLSCSEDDVQSLHETDLFYQWYIDRYRQSNLDALWVFSAGNGGAFIAQSSPARLSVVQGNDNVVSVAAVDNKSHLMGFDASGKNIGLGPLCKPGGSDYGNQVTIAAPGVEIYSDVPGGGFSNGTILGIDTCDATGTSFAAPFVTGVAGLMLAANPALTASQLKATIRATAIHTGNLDPLGDEVLLLDASAAVKRAQALPVLNVSTPDCLPGLSCSGTQGAAFTFEGTGFSTSGAVRRFVQDPAGQQTELSPALSSDASGRLTWSMKTSCSTTVGTYLVSAVDSVTMLASNFTSEVVSLGACGTQPTITSVSASCSPANVVGGQSSTCTATVQGIGDFDPTVTWTASIGTITSSGLESGLYTAPSSSLGTVTIVAASKQDPSKSASTSVVVVAALPPPTGSFQAAGPEGATFFQALAVDQTSAGTVYASAFQYGLFKSSDGGVHWNSLNATQSPETIYDIKVSSRSGAIYIGSSDGHAYRSTDRGNTWTQLPSPTTLTSDNAVAQIALDPGSDDKIYVANKQGKYLSVDAGMTWSPLSPPTSCNGSIASDPATAGKVYSASGSAFCVSSDSGKTWAVNTLVLPSNTSIVRFVIAPTDSRRIYLVAAVGVASVGDYVYKSSDGGMTWMQILAGYSIGQLVVHSSSSDVVFANVSNGSTSGYFGLLTTTDGGQTWTQTNTPPLSGQAGGLVMIPGSSPSLLGSWGSHLWDSQDQGLTWVDADAGISATFGFAVTADPNEPSVVYYAAANGVGLFKTSNSGNVWSSVLLDSCYGISVDPFASTHLLASCGASTSNPVLSESLDGGVSWHTVSSQLPLPIFPESIVFDPSTKGTIYVGFPIGETNGGIGVAKSTNGGTSWAAIDNGLTGEALNVRAIAIDPRNSQTLLACTSAGVYRSTDGGANWLQQNPLVGVGPSTVSFDPNRANTVYLAAGGALYKSLDDGVTYAQVNLGRSDVELGSVVLVDPKTPDVDSW